MEKQSLNQRLDQIVSMTQQDRVDSNLYKLEIDTYLKQIDHLKLSELNLKRQVNKLKQQINAGYKEAAESNDKYARELEHNKQLEQQVKLHISKIEEYEQQTTLLNSKLEETTLCANAMQAKIEK